MKIDSKTLRKLRKAGFPLKDVAQELSDLGIIVPIPQFKTVFPNSIWCDGKLYLPPTLEQAFKALGRRFSSLARQHLKKAPFVAWAGDVCVTDASPLETLLKLYLTIQKKS